MTNFDKVEEFMTTFGQEVKSKIDLGDRNLRQLRYDLIKEELGELREAFERKEGKEESQIG